MVYLVQTDTTLGLISHETSKLDFIKNRPSTKQYLQNVSSLSSLKSQTRIPNQHKKIVRRAKKTTFVYPNNSAIRVSFDERFNQFLRTIEPVYSTSANLSGKEIDVDWAKNNVDVVVDEASFDVNAKASKIIKLGKHKIVQLR